ncbi:hypothetical protein JTB14_017227 [Gonioctena quinquepunctata]|nr:hypothetical protein JTB14_017227 [Gonioctena quinquepunctata]
MSSLTPTGERSFMSSDPLGFLIMAREIGREKWFMLKLLQWFIIFYVEIFNAFVIYNGFNGEDRGFLKLFLVVVLIQQVDAEENKINYPAAFGLMASFLLGYAFSASGQHMKDEVRKMKYKGYGVVRRDRLNRDGGIAIYYKAFLSLEVLENNDYDHTLEQLWCDHLYEALCNCNWIEWNKRNRMALQMILRDTAKPLSLSSLGLVELDMVLIKKVVNVTYSLVTVYFKLKQ